MKNKVIKQEEWTYTDFVQKESNTFVKELNICKFHPQNPETSRYPWCFCLMFKSTLA